MASPAQLPLRHLPQPLHRPWLPFVIAGLSSTISVGALSGAIDLWSLRVRLLPVPIDHHRGHAIGQVFGFLLLITMGLSLHLVPRFFNGALDSRWAKHQATLAISGLVGAVVGRLGALVPGSTWFGVVGASLLLIAVLRWFALMWVHVTQGTSIDHLGRFFLAGVAWWVLASTLLLGWSLMSASPGPLASLGLQGIWTAALVGGTGSWIFGIMLRAGSCVLRIERPTPSRQRLMFWGWQLAATAQCVATVHDSLQRPAAAMSALGVVITLSALRPWTGALMALTDEPFVRRIVQAAMVSVALWGALLLVTALGVTNVLFVDATRHVFTLGFASLAVFGFGGRMIPSFAGVSLEWPAAYTAGSLAVMLAVPLRLAECLPSRIGLALAGTSGVLAAAGVLTMTACLFISLAPSLRREAERQAPTARHLRPS